MTQLIHPFPLYVFKHKVSNSLQLKQHFFPLITELVQEKKKTLNPPSAWLCTELTTSYSNTSVNGELFKDSELLIECYREIVPILANNKQTGCEVTAIWFNYYTKDDYQEWHDHIHRSKEENSLGVNFSFVYFLSFDPSYHGPLTFKDPLHALRRMSLDKCIHDYNPHWSPEINEGDIIVFPTYLEHCVKPYIKNVDNPVPRITISGNMTVEVAS